MRNFNSLGGGAKSSLTNKNSSSIFKPLIASSLALALGVSVAVATNQDPITTNSGTSTQSFSGETTITAGSDGNSVTAGGDGKNDLTFQASGTISGDIYAKDRGSNKIVFENTATINGKIISGEKDNDNNASPSGSTNHNNLIIFKGTTASIGASGAKTSIILDNNNASSAIWQGSGRFSNNTIAFDSKTAGTIYLDSLQSIGEGGGSGGKQGSKNFTLISLDNKTSNTVNTVSIDSIVGKVASNIIGSGLYDITSETYATNLFEYDTKISATKMKSGFVTEFVKTNYSASGTFTFGSIKSGHGGGNYFNLNGTTTITGNILSQGDRNDQIGHDNIFVLSGTLATIGEQNKKVSIIIENSDDQTGVAFQALSTNTLLLKATTNTLYLSELTSKGDYNTKENFNLISFNAGTNTLNSDKVLAFRGHNIIGQNVITQADGYGTTLFNSGKGGSPAIKSVPTFITEFVKTSYSASGTFTFGSIEATYGGANYLNLNGTTTITGNILSKGEAHKAINDGTNHNNIIAFSGTSVTIGNSGKKSSIIVDNNADDGQMWLAYSNNTLIFGANKNTLTLKDIKVEGDSNYDKTFNVLSFNNTTASANSLSVENVFARNGYNIIGKNLVTQSGGYNSALFALDADKETISLTENFLTEFAKNTYTAEGGTYTFSDIQTTAYGVNAINVNTLAVSGDIHSKNGSNCIYTSSLTGTNLNIKAHYNGNNLINVSTTLTLNSILIDATTEESVLDNAKNTINFAGDSLTVSSGITTAGKWGSRGINEVNLTKASATLAISDQGITTRKTNHTDQTGYFQQNIITFTDGGSITLSGTDRTDSGTTINFDGILASDSNKNTITFNGTNNATITAVDIRTTNNGKNVIDFKGSGTNKIQGIISNYGNSTNITFAGTTNTITGNNGQADGVGGIYSGGGSTTITFDGGTNSINGKLNINNTDLTNLSTNSIVNQGGTLTINLKSGSLSTGGVWHRVFGYKTIFNAEQGSNITLSSLSIHGNNGNNEGVEFNFTNGGTLNFTNGAELKYDDFSKAKLVVDFGGSANATLNGDITTREQGIVSISFGGTQTNTLQGNLITNENGDAQITLANNGTNLSLKGKSGNATTTHQINSLVATDSGNNILTLDNSTTSNGAMTTTIHSVVNGENLAVVLNGQDNKSVTLTFDNASGTTLKSVALDTDATTANTLAFGAGSNKIVGAVSIGASQGLTLDLSGANTSLNLVGGFIKSGNGVANINVKADANATLNGGAIDATKLTFAGASTLTINNSSASFTDISVDAGNSTLSGIALSSSNLTFADNTSLTLNNAGDSFGLVNTTSASTNGATLTIDGNLDASIAQLQGNNLKVNFAKREQNGNAKLSILDSNTNNKTITLKGVSVANDSTNNTLDLSSLSTVNIGSAVSLADGTGLTLKLKDTNLTVTGGTDSRITDEAKGALTISVDSGVGSTSTATSSLTATGGSLNITNLDMVGSGTTKVTFKSNAEIGTLTAQASAGNELTIGESGDITVTINTTNSTLGKVTLAGATADLQIKGGTQTINNLVTTATTANKLTLSNNNLTLGTITNTDSKAINVDLTESTLSLASSSTISSLKTDGKSIINLAVGHIGSNVVSKAGQSRSDAPVRNKLTITTLSGNLSANVFVGKSQADQIQIDNATNGNILTLYARGNASEIISITRNDNVLVADTQNAGGNVTVEGGTSDIGGLVVALTVEEDTATTGKWYVGKTEVKGVDKSFQEVASSALAVNYDLYLANFNSLNKRMGELRDNPYNQGVWARVFGGAMSNDIGSGSKTQYVTAQAGYDYSLTLGDARNYMGIAVAYGSSTTKANEGVGLTNAFLDNINSQMVEVGIYNSYVMDNGWYNDTIFKFDYIMSDFDISVQNGGSSTHNSNNFAMILSDEFGYRYKFAESAKGNWYIDPQVEMAFGYFNQSDFNQAIANNFTTVEASQDAILTLRTRAGLSLGKKFISSKGFATLYVGAFYEYDYIDGGNAQTQTLGVTNTLDSIESNGRAIVNIGSNIELTEGVRMYIDVEKSFGDKQRVDMQFNFGARYSFGEKVPTISYQEQQKKRVAPLKVEEKQEATTQSATQEQEAKN